MQTYFTENILASALYACKYCQGRDYDGLSYAPMDTDDFTLGLMMDCWVKIICRRDDGFENVRKKTDPSPWNRC